MNQSDRFFRWAFNIFIFLMFANLGMVIALKSIYFEAEKRMTRNGAEVAFACGDYDSADSFWAVPKSDALLSLDCKRETCPESLWERASGQEEALHVVSIGQPRPSQVVDGKLVPGHFVDLDLRLESGGNRLVLVSQQMLQWNLQFKETPQNHVEWVERPPVEFFTGFLPLASSVLFPYPRESLEIEKPELKEIIVVSPDLVWLEGVPAGTKVTYFNNKQICAYPTAWEEIQNPRNEFRRLLRALKEYTGLDVTHFQGKKVARHLEVPFRGPHIKQKFRPKRGLSSQAKKGLEEDQLVWERQGQSLVASQLTTREGRELTHRKLPQATRDAFYDRGTKNLFVIQKYQFGIWDEKAEKFQALKVPLNIPALYWPTSMTFNPLRSEIYIYNDDRGGEIYVYNVVTKAWHQMATQMGYSFVSLYFDVDKESLFASRFQGRQIREILEFDSRGQVKGRRPLAKPLDFIKTQWRARFIPGSPDLRLKIAHPAQPSGELHWLHNSETVEGATAEL